MKVSTNLLKQLSGIELDDREIIELISKHIAQVEDFHSLENDYKDIVIAQIVEKKEHPNADKLGIYMITDGSKNTIQVVAGDKKLEVGDKVAYLRPGSTVPYTIYTEHTPIVISKRKMRDVESNGMLGSEKELNVGPNHAMVMRLPDDAPVGELFSRYYELNDTVIDIENKALTNRGDLFGVVGIARELAAITNSKFISPDWYTNTTKKKTKKTNILELEIHNDAEILCPRYAALAFDNIKAQDSPVWLKSFLIKSDITPINNIVDITNYISHLMGQPLHAFDFDKVINKDSSSKEIVHINIRMAKDGEKILGLDKKMYELDSDTVVIADNENPIAIAGIIGGEDTQIDENTKRVILECANFDKTSIRKTSMRLGVSTEAATKFKHALSPNLCIPALNKATELIKELGNATIASDIIDIYQNPTDTKVLTFSVDRANLILGTKLDKKTIEQILINLEYVIENTEGENIKVRVPFWRTDIDIKEDIFEDIGRIYGYNNIEFKLPKRDISPSKENALFNIKKRIREILSNSGANETDTYSFTNLEVIKKCNQDPNLAYIIKNALAPELSLMRTSVISSLLSKSQENIQRGYNQFVLYEMNIAHQKGLSDGIGLPIENWSLSLVLTDALNSTQTSAYYLAKAYLEKIFSKLNIKGIEYYLISNYSEKNLSMDIKNLLYLFDPNTSALVIYKDKVLGVIGEFHTKVKENFKLPVYSSGIEINLNTILEIEKGENKFSDIPKYPSSMKDISIEVNKEVEYIDLEQEIKKIINKDKLWGEISCIDIYSNDKQESKKKITFRLTIRNFEKTLNNKDTEKILEKIEKTLVQGYNAKVI